MRGPKPSASRSARGQSELVGTILLLGIVVTVGGIMLLVGSTAIGDLRSTVAAESTEHTMREIDSRLSRVAFSENNVETLDFSSASNIELHSESYMDVTVNGTSQCSARIRMGSITKETDRGRVIAYEGGGVWYESGNGSAMLSPPDLQYREGTINFPLVSVNGTVSGDGGRLVAEKNTTLSRQRSREITRGLTQPASVCQPPGNITITVKSEYYQAWGRYFAEITGEPVTYDHSNGTASVVLSSLGPATNARLSGNSVTANTSYVADIKINGTGYHANGFHLPFAFRVEIEGRSPMAFSADHAEPDGTRLVDRDVNMSYTNGAGNIPVADDMNNPMVSHENDRYPTESISVDAGKAFAVVGISYYCDSTSNALDRADDGNDEPDSEDASNEDGDGMLDTDPSFPGRAGGMDDRCIADGLGDRELRNLSTGGGNAQADNLLVFNSTRNLVTKYIDYDEFTSASSQQRSPDEVIASIYTEYPDDSVPGRPGYSDPDTDEEIVLDLQDNQALYIYEFNEDPDTDPNTFQGDFNDAIVLITVRKQGTISPSGSFSIKISTSKVRIVE